VLKIVSSIYLIFLFLGVRIFVPNPVSKTIEYIGGPHVMLGLIAMSNDIESFYASVKAFVCILKSNKQMQNELLRTRAYQVKRSSIFLFFKYIFYSILDSWPFNIKKTSFN
jgi:hypothetical protein